MYELAVIYMESGRPNEARTRFAEALKLRKARLGPDHPDTLDAMNGLAWTYLNTGRIDEGTSLVEEVLRLRKARLGPDHPDTLHSMFGVAVAYGHNGWVSKAIPRFEEALELRRAKFGRDNRWTLQSLQGLAWADLYLDGDRLDEAIRLSEEALKLLKVKFGPDHPYTLESMDVRAGALGQTRLRQKKYGEAEPLLREYLSYRERLAPHDWSRFHSQSLLGASLLGQKRFGDAEPLLTGGYEGMEQRAAKIPAPLKLHLTEGGERVVRLYDEWGKAKEAAEWRAKLAHKVPVVNNEPKP
jgi:tetratricopeptide (TPR) repeat protein